MKPLLSSHSIPSTTAGVIDAHVFEACGSSSSSSPTRGTVITVHPWSALGGGEHNTVGLARCIITDRHNEKDAVGGIASSWRVVTFKLQSNSYWRGGWIWGICSNHAHEVQQIVDVIRWVRQKYGVDESVVLLGSSAGAPMAGTAMACLVENEVGNTAALSAYVAVGYTFGIFAALGFGRHFPSLLSSSVRCIPKLFIMGDKDEFTSVNQLEDMAQKIIDQNRNEGSVDVEIVPNVGHFELESPKYDLLVSRLVLDWLDKHL